MLESGIRLAMNPGCRNSWGCLRRRPTRNNQRLDRKLHLVIEISLGLPCPIASNFLVVKVWYASVDGVDRKMMLRSAYSQSNHSIIHKYIFAKEVGSDSSLIARAKLLIDL